jgi:hypothetical protein
MDIAKYMVTAIILTSIFSDVREKWLVYVISALSVAITLWWGLYLVKESPVKSKRRK